MSKIFRQHIVARHNNKRFSNLFLEAAQQPLLPLSPSHRHRQQTTDMAAETLVKRASIDAGAPAATTTQDKASA